MPLRISIVPGGNRHNTGNSAGPDRNPLTTVGPRHSLQIRDRLAHGRKGTRAYQQTSGGGRPELLPVILSAAKDLKKLSRDTVERRTMMVGVQYRGRSNILDPSLRSG